MINNKYYFGFEGEPEIQIIQKRNDNDYVLSIWEGYFDRIMSQMKPDKTGWTGIAYFYHLHTGWYDDDMWVDKNIIDSYNKFKSICKERLDKKSGLVLEQICKLLNEAVLNNHEIIIRRE
jgi:hypothetical protein